MMKPWTGWLQLSWGFKDIPFPTTSHLPNIPDTTSTIIPQLTDLSWTDHPIVSDLISHTKDQCSLFLRLNNSSSISTTDQPWRKATTWRIFKRGEDLRSYVYTHTNTHRHMSHFPTYKCTLPIRMEGGCVYQWIGNNYWSLSHHTWINQTREYWRIWLQLLTLKV